MSGTRIQLSDAGAIARKAGAAAGLMLLVVLLLDWMEVEVSSSAINEGATRSGLHGWGFFAGSCLLVLLLRRGIQAIGGPGGPFVDAVLAVAVLGFAIARFLDVGETQVAGLTVTRVGARLWPAWAGIGLAGLVALAGLVVLVDSVAARHRNTPPSTPA